MVPASLLHQSWEEELFRLGVVRLEGDSGVCCGLSPRCHQQGSAGGAQEAASCPHRRSGDKGSQTARQAPAQQGQVKCEHQRRPQKG